MWVKTSGRSFRNHRPKRIERSSAKKEINRAAAVALEQEMKAKVEEMNAQVVEAEAVVPQALADAFRSGNLGVLD